MVYRAEIVAGGPAEHAIAYIAFLSTVGNIAAESNRRRYALHLTSQYVVRLHDPRYQWSYNLFDVGGTEELERALGVLQTSEAYRLSQRTNGGNGVFQATFGKYRAFWAYLEAGHGIDERAIAAARPQWAIVCRRLERMG